MISGRTGGLIVYTDAAGSTFQIEFTEAGGTGAVCVP
jgi:hypothetical protein